jgi:hypothetical protein
MQLIEIGVLAACLYVLSSSISFLDLVSFSGYKYIPLVINTIVFQLLGSIAYYVSLLYTGVAVSYFTVRAAYLRGSRFECSLTFDAATAQLHEGKRSGADRGEPPLPQLPSLWVRLGCFESNPSVFVD